MRKIYLLAVCILLTIVWHDVSAGHKGRSSALSFFPQQAITGQVSDEANNPLPGVNVLVKGSTVGTVTDGDGKFSLPVVAGNSVIIFSFIGYTTQEVDASSKTVINVTMEPDVKSLNEVVITALGIKKESKKLGYSTTSVKADEMVANRTNNMMESLEGKVAGLNITPPAAGAGASTQIRLRGQVGFSGANNSPLIVVNGLPMDQGARSADGLGTPRDRGDNLLNINPDDIESMTVLKGSTASALYGSRAAAGAILITTKSGAKNQGVGVEFTSSFTAQKPLNFMGEIIQTKYGQGTGGNRPSSAANAVSTGQYSFGERLDGVPTPIFDGSLQPYSANPNGLFDYLQTGKTFTNTIALSGGGANGNFRASFSNTAATGIEPRNEYKRKIANVGINHDITKRLKMSLNVNYANEEQINPPQIGTQGAGSVNFFTRVSPSIPHSAFKKHAIAENGTETPTSGFQGTLLNPYYANKMKQMWVNERNRILATTTLRYDIKEWLYIQGRYNFDYLNDFTESHVPGGIGTSAPKHADDTYKGTYNVVESTNRDINADFLVGANKEFGKFSIDASFGGNTWRSENHNFNQTATNFIVRDLYSIGNGNVKTQTFGYGKRRVNSLYGLAEFGYNGLLYINFTGRTDWFSVYNPKDNNEFYPSVSGSFIFSELLPDQKWLSYGKLRASYAEVGSAMGVDTYEGLLNYTIAQNAFNGQTTATVANNASGVPVSPNPNLKPFSVEEVEIGLEVRLFDNKVLLDVSAFNKVTTDQVLEVTLSNTSGYDRSKANLASLRNRGLEGLVEVTPVQTGDFTWTSSWNHAYLKTKVLEISPSVDDFLLLNFNTTGNEFLGQIRYTKGLAMNQLYTRTYLRDDNGDILVTAQGRLRPTADYVPVGSSIPNHTGGWTNTFSYKNLSLGIHIDYKFGGTVLSSTALNLLRAGHSKASLVGRREGETGIVFPGVYDDGEPNGSVVTDLQGFYADYRNHQIGDPFIFKSDFVKLRNISISYNLTDVVHKTPFLSFVKGLSVTASCRNVAILYKDLPGLDPEAIQSSGDVRAGYENASLPTTRNYNFSLNVKF
jgi:TonB-linked SusC/RagA family outer membrane protein